MTTPQATLDEAITAAVSKRFKLDPAIAGKALQCMAGGSPVPYLARYNREAVGGLDERTLYAMRREVRRARELEQRRQFILRAIGERSDVPAKLRSRIERCSCACTWRCTAKVQRISKVTQRGITSNAVAPPVCL